MPSRLAVMEYGVGRVRVRVLVPFERDLDSGLVGEHGTWNSIVPSGMGERSLAVYPPLPSP